MRFSSTFAILAAVVTASYAAVIPSIQGAPSPHGLSLARLPRHYINSGGPGSDSPATADSSANADVSPACADPGNSTASVNANTNAVSSGGSANAGVSPASNAGSGNPSTSVNADTNAVSSASTGSAPAACACHTIPDIISDVTSKISPLVAQLKNLNTPGACTVAQVTPIINQIKPILSGAIDQVKAISSNNVSGDAAMISSTAGGILSSLQLCTLIATLFKMIFGVFGVLMKVVVDAESKGVCALFSDVSLLLATLLQLIFGVVSGLGGILKVLLSVVAPVMSELHTDGVFNSILGGYGGSLTSI
ncbi:hypothetical protein D9758_015959 [Tetrapyrgos nigripes]|uniref:Uncharacterized protein n=1 Tax=Tetrapyrgos nigripes TaxID=182062 RepID=A0A8H5FDX0_9AGAR|nr:hypothetical protein D9758_015959 [Tetrapyrgos nigripes]